jgi:predicted RNA binding protein with dsRBD fold (UPF0201 family)
MKLINESGRLTEDGREFVSHFEADLDAIFLSHDFVVLSDNEKKTLESILKAIVADKFSTNRVNRAKFTEREERLADEFSREGVDIVVTREPTKLQKSANDLGNLLRSRVNYTTEISSIGVREISNEIVIYLKKQRAFTGMFGTLLLDLIEHGYDGNKVIVTYTGPIKPAGV